jgi:hypothetical protein
MNESLFIEFVAKFFPKLQSLIEKINGKRNKPLSYLHKTMLRTEYSADQKWESASINSTYVAADIVSMDSPLPVKKRDVVAHSNGKLPKVGMKKTMKETDINAINIMKARGANFALIASKLTNDAYACSVGIDEKNELNFLTALSDGYVLVQDEDNAGLALRVSFEFLPDNCFGVATVGELTLDDIKRVLAKADADGNAISTIAIAQSTYNKLRASRGARELVASYMGQTYSAETTLPVPPAKAFDEAFSDDNNGVKFLKIDRSVIVEMNGTRKSIKPFNANKLTFLVDDNEVGALVWGTLAEATNPVNGVVYTTVDGYKLISKYSKTDPLQEFTAGQALVLPVLENIDQIYSLDITDAQPVDDDEQEGDSTITIWGHVYNKSEVTAAMDAMGIIPLGSTDAAYIKTINELSDKDEARLKKALVYYPEVTPDTLNFTKAADGTGKTVAVDTNASATDLAAATVSAGNDDWIIPTISGKTITVKVTANSEVDAPARQGTVTLTIGEKTATVTVKQAANT